MSASRKLYRGMAETIGREIGYAGEAESVALFALAGCLASDLKHDNAAFDRTRFMDAIEAEATRVRSRS